MTGTEAETAVEEAVAADLEASAVPEAAVVEEIAAGEMTAEAEEPIAEIQDTAPETVAENLGSEEAAESSNEKGEV